MPIGEYERHILPFNLHVTMVPEETEPQWSMREAVDLLLKIYKDGGATMRVGEYVGEDEDEEQEASEQEGANVILIRKMIVNAEGEALILLHHGDAGAADPALMQIRSGTIRHAGKRSDEGLAHASHLIISTKKHLSPSGQSRALLERVPNLGRSTVVAFLNRLLRLEAARQSLEYEDNETKRVKRYHPKLTSQQQLSHRLKSDLQKGKLSRIEFVTRTVVGGFEEPNRVVPVTQTIVHKVINAPTGSAVFDLLQRAKTFARKHNFEEMQIRFRKPDTEQHVSPRFATALTDAEEAVYSRLEILREFRKPLEQCPIDVVPELRDKMMALFRNQELWK
jgi:hypothetical protein